MSSLDHSIRRDRRRNLIVLRAGDNSLHPGWIASPSRDFDLFVSYYGRKDRQHAEDAEFYEHRPGPKWSCIADLLDEHPSLLDHYESFWFPDDDLEADTETLNQMFALFQGLNLKLAQPALTRDSYYSWRQLLQDSRFVMRQVAFVEVMAPIFSRQSLRLCRESLRSSRSGWGLDWVWPILLGGSTDGRIGVLDATAVKHTRPIGGGDLYKANPELDPNMDSQRLASTHGFAIERFTAKFVVHGALGYGKLPWFERLVLAMRRLNARRLGWRRRHQDVRSTPAQQKTP